MEVEDEVEVEEEEDEDDDEEEDEGDVGFKDIDDDDESASKGLDFATRGVDNNDADDEEDRFNRELTSCRRLERVRAPPSAEFATRLEGSKRFLTIFLFSSFKRSEVDKLFWGDCKS